MSDKQQHKGSASSKPAKSSVPINERIDEIVAKAVPAKWLGTTAAGLAIATLLFFIFMVVFAFSGPAPVSEEITRLEKQLADEQKARSDDNAALNAKRDKDTAALNAKLDAARTERKAAEKKAKDLSAKAALLTRAENAEKKYKAERDKARKALATETAARKAAERKLSSTTGGTAKADAARQRAETAKAALETKLKKLKLEYNALQKQDKDAEFARNAFNDIIEATGQIDDLGTRIERMERMSADARAALAQTSYDTRLKKEIASLKREQDLIARKAAGKAKKDATATYSKGIASLKTVSDPGEQMAILRELKQKLAGTRYVAVIDKKIVMLEGQSKGLRAKAAYDAAMKQVNANPKAHRENLQAIEDAIGETEGTRWAKMLQKLADTKKKTLSKDVGAAALAELSTQIKQNPKSYDDNIAAGEAALARAEGSGFEAKITVLLKKQKAARSEVVGRSAYDRALAQVKGSPKDYRANVDALEVLKAQARGSKWEAKIDKLLAKQKKLLARSSGE